MSRIENKILEIVGKEPTVWWRYIDDVFVVWPHDESCLKEYINEINGMHPTIKFTIKFKAKWSNQSVALLDVKVVLKDI